jgi:hypothetical protein
MVNEAPPRKGKDDGGVRASERRPSVTKTATTAALNQHLEVAVEEAEKSLLRGQHRRALKDANRCLVFALSQHHQQQQQQAVSSDDSAEEDCFRVEAPLFFPLVFDETPGQQHPLCICIDFMPSDCVDRAAAVALQSWYEVSQRITMDAPVVHESHLRLLQPFWRVYGCVRQNDSASFFEAPARSCSLELAVVLVQFCRATSHVREAAELALATLDRVLSSGDPHCYRLLREQLSLIQELLAYLLCDLMPHAVDEGTVEAALGRLSEPSSPAREEREPAPSSVDAWRLSDSFNPRAARTIVRFLQNPPVHWPDEIQGSLESCLQQLEDNLAKFQQDTQCGSEDRSSSAHAADRADPWDGSSALTKSESALLDHLAPPARVPVSGVRDAASGRFERLPTLGWDAAAAFRLGLFRLAYVARVAAIEPLVLSQRRWSNRGTVAVSVWAVWMAWRERGRFSRGARLALRLLLKPLREIVDAIIPNNQRR